MRRFVLIALLLQSISACSGGNSEDFDLNDESQTSEVREGHIKRKREVPEESKEDGRNAAEESDGTGVQRVKKEEDSESDFGISELNLDPALIDEKNLKRFALGPASRRMRSIR